MRRVVFAALALGLLALPADAGFLHVQGFIAPTAPPANHCPITVLGGTITVLDGLITVNC